MVIMLFFFSSASFFCFCLYLTLSSSDFFLLLHPGSLAGIILLCFLLLISFFLTCFTFLPIFSGLLVNHTRALEVPHRTLVSVGKFFLTFSLNFFSPNIHFFFFTALGSPKEKNRMLQITGRA